MWGLEVKFLAFFSTFTLRSDYSNGKGLGCRWLGGGRGNFRPNRQPELDENKKIPAWPGNRIPSIQFVSDHNPEHSAVVQSLLFCVLCNITRNTPTPNTIAQQRLVGPGPSHYWNFTNTLSHTTLGRTPLDEWSARRTDLYLHNTKHSQQTNIHAHARYSNPQFRQVSGRRPMP